MTGLWIIGLLLMLAGTILTGYALRFEDRELSRLAYDLGAHWRGKFWSWIGRHPELTALLLMLFFLGFALLLVGATTLVVSNVGPGWLRLVLSFTFLLKAAHGIKWIRFCRRHEGLTRYLQYYEAGFVVNVVGMVLFLVAAPK